MLERNGSAEEIFNAVLDKPTAERPEYLRAATAYSPELRAQVEAMLAEYHRILNAPADPQMVSSQIVPGTRFGRYLMHQSIGAGGMGEVYRALDMTLNRTVAIKILPPGKRKDDLPAWLRFLNEAQLASSLNHPGIVALYDIAQHEGTDFLVMEYVEGKTLRDLIPESGLPLDQLIAFGSQIAQALGAAHAAGIVHRDIKPANIMVTSAGAVKVLDFGVAKGAMHDEIQLTGVGQIVGTIAYMSPEQTRGEPLDFRSDIFSLGIVLYQAATGKLPFVSENTVGLLHQVNRGEPSPLGQHRPDLPAAFLRLVMRCLAKDREDRPESAIAVATELRTLDLSSGPAASSLGTRRDAVAVLPMKIRGAASDRFLSTSLAEAIVHRLSTAGGLVVRPLSSTLRYAGEDVEWTTPARELNVDLIVEGTVHIAGGRIRVLAQVHRLGDRQTLASIKQDGDFDDLFALQDRLTDAVSDVFLPRAASPDTRVPPTRNSAAFELYLRAVDRQVHVEKFEMQSAIELLTRAVEMDPNFADAWGLLAQACAQMGSHLDSDPKWFAMGEQAIARALELDPVQCTALCAKGMIVWSPSRSFQNRAALRALNAALKIDPSRPTARHQRSGVLWHLGFTRAAEADAQQLKLTSPALGIMHLAAAALQSGRFEQSAELYYRALEIEPNGVLNHVMSPMAILYAGRTEEARQRVANARRLFPAESFGLGMEAILAGLEGDVRRAEQLADEAALSTHSLTHTHHTWHSCAAAYALCGRTEKALHELERCAAMGLPNYQFFLVDPCLQSLRGNARFDHFVTTLRRQQDSIREEFAIEVEGPPSGR